jgi:hypothetical protein
MRDTTTALEINGGENLCRRARRMIAEGANPETLIAWIRGGRPVFKRPASLATWEAFTVVERDRTSARFERFIPFRGAVSERSSCPAATPDAPEATSACARDPSDAPEPVEIDARGYPQRPIVCPFR